MYNKARGKRLICRLECLIVDLVAKVKYIKRKGADLYTGMSNTTFCYICTINQEEVDWLEDKDVLYYILLHFGTINQKEVDWLEDKEVKLCSVTFWYNKSRGSGQTCTLGCLILRSVTFWYTKSREVDWLVDKDV